jgi:Anti-sigma-28 factor, FlgM
MEIAGVNSVHSVKQVIRGEAVQTACIEDTVAISSEAQKKAEWVEKLKQMPDIRPEKIAQALVAPPVSASELAHKMLQSDF